MDTSLSKAADEPLPLPGSRDTATNRLAAALRFQTVASYPHPADPAAFTAFLAFLARSFPALFELAELTQDDPWRLVLELQGADPSLLAVLFMGHYDVVPVDQSTSSEWTHPPFSGDVEDGYVWGRGAIDDKASVMAILEAAEGLARSGQKPKRGLVIALGGDEEISGSRGAQQTAAQFRSIGRQFHFVLDEGSAIVRGMQADVPAPLALVGLAEKGLMDVRVSARTTGGHAAMPPSTTALGIVGRAITRIERNQFPVRRLQSLESFFRVLARVATGPTRLVYRFPRLLWPLIARILSGKPSTNSLIRTTQALTMAGGSAAANALPQEAFCVVNVRIMPGETTGSVLAHFKRVLRRLPVTVSLLDGDAHDPIPETVATHTAFAALSDSLAETAPEVVTVPFIVTSTTDSRHFVGLSEAILRFVPMTLTPDDLDRVHGINERMSISDYERMIRFYSDFIERVCWNE